MKSWWQYFKQAFTKKECEWIINYSKNIPISDAFIGSGQGYVINESFRRSKIRWLNKCAPELAEMYSRINEMALQANASAFGFDIQGFPHVQFTEYHAQDEGTYDWHEDNNFTNSTPFDRKISMVIQLSDADEYTGGKLKLHHEPLPDDVFCNQGDAIFFPSFNRHMVTPVKLGTRYSLVTWFVGPKFR
jgi:PKHD-type hydroxylase